jgi:GTP1/Obg family GTP-binding protein
MKSLRWPLSGLVKDFLQTVAPQPDLQSIATQTAEFKKVAGVYLQLYLKSHDAQILRDLLAAIDTTSAVAQPTVAAIRRILNSETQRAEEIAREFLCNIGVES